MAALYPQPWERNLLARAYQAEPSTAQTRPKPFADAALLERAYFYCDALTAKHSHSFYFTSGLLPPEKRRAIRALYAFCRVSDNLVDCPDADCAERLAAWRKRTLTLEYAPTDLVATAWADTRVRFQIPAGYAEQLIEGVGRDLIQTRYPTFQALTEYAYGVASTVGLMSMHIIGYAGPQTLFRNCSSDLLKERSLGETRNNLRPVLNFETVSQAIPYAVKLGVALQLTNILRDVGEDWRAGRLYLPQDELAIFGVTEQDIEHGCVDERWRKFMRFQIGRNRQLYVEAMPGIQMLNRDGRFAVRAAAELYRGILDDIQAHDYDVFHRRAHVSRWGKLRKLPGIWFRSLL